MKKLLTLVITTAVGGGLGYCYYLLFGCEKSCNLSSNWQVTTIYGAAIGLIAGVPKINFKHDKNK